MTNSNTESKKTVLSVLRVDEQSNAILIDTVVGISYQSH